MERYPTRNGIAIPVKEIYLPQSKLDLDDPHNENLHHGEWTARQFGRSILFSTVRNIAITQTILPIDIHNYLHSHYDPPKQPTARQAIEMVDNSYHNKDELRIRRNGKYTKQLISNELYKLCLNDYQKNK